MTLSPQRNPNCAMSRWRVFRIVRATVTDFDDVCCIVTFRSGAVLASSAPIRGLVLLGNEPVVMALGPLVAMLSCSLNLLVSRAFGTHCPEGAKASPAGQDVPQAVPLWACTKLRRTASGSSIGNAALTRCKNVCIAMRLEVVQTPLISRS